MTSSGIRVCDLWDFVCAWACVHGRSREARERGLIVARSFVGASLLSQSHGGGAVGIWGVAIYFVAWDGCVRFEWAVRVGSKTYHQLVRVRVPEGAWFRRAFECGKSYC